MIHSISSSHSASAPGLSPRRSAAKKSFTTWTFSWALIEILALLPGSVLLTPSGHGSRTHEFEQVRIEFVRMGGEHSMGISLVDLQRPVRSEEHTSELQSLMRMSYAVFCLKKQQENAAVCNKIS